jgi:hypothetical protein
LIIPRRKIVLVGALHAKTAMAGVGTPRLAMGSSSERERRGEETDRGRRLLTVGRREAHGGSARGGGLGHAARVICWYVFHGAALAPTWGRRKEEREKKKKRKGKKKRRKTGGNFSKLENFRWEK